jgi:hypothetical protein
MCFSILHSRRNISQPTGIFISRRMIQSSSLGLVQAGRVLTERGTFWERSSPGVGFVGCLSEGQLLGKAKWEKLLADWITATGVGLVGQDRGDKEAERVERNDGWRRGPFL